MDDPGLDGLRAWVGRQEIVDDPMPPFPAAALTATLDRADAPGPGDPLPPLWHWVHFLPLHRWSELSENGHGRHGDFIPPVPLPRRMYAGGRMTFPRSLVIGEPARRVSTIRDLTLKTGRTGRLAFLSVRTEITGPRGLAVTEDQDIVFREAPAPGAPPETPPSAPARSPRWSRRVVADEAILFRYSALIFNAHRIHFDHPYTVEREGYPGLVVHGQLTATLLAELVRDHVPRRMTGFRFRALRPLLAGQPFTLHAAPEGDGIALWALDHADATAMEATAELGD